MSISLTESAAERVQHFLDNRGSGIGLRLGVKTTGCSGMAYVLEFVDAAEAEDTVFEVNGIKIIIDPKYGEILGAHIIGSGATELIAEMGLAITTESTYEDIEATIHAHPTLAEAIHEATCDAFGHAVHI